MPGDKADDPMPWWFGALALAATGACCCVPGGGLLVVFVGLCWRAARWSFGAGE